MLRPEMPGRVRGVLVSKISFVLLCECADLCDPESPVSHARLKARRGPSTSHLSVRAHSAAKGPQFRCDLQNVTAERFDRTRSFDGIRSRVRAKPGGRITQTLCGLFAVG